MSTTSSGPPISNSDLQSGPDKPRSSSMAANSDEVTVEQPQAPLYGTTVGQVDLDGKGFKTLANVAADGRLNITINQKTKQIPDLLVPALEI
ncbi:MAG: hypothetical protein Q9218_001222 [Villophora microphyllina]